MASITLKNITKTYEDGNTVISDLNLEIKDKEFIILVGPSGCGKSTTLRMIAGLEEVTSGDLFIGDKRVNDDAPKDRDIAMVFQSYALYPHMTVYKNMAFALELRKVNKKEIDRKVREVAKILEIEDYLNRKPRALSGGQRQRVALGRAMVRDPAVFLLDEPLSNLDAKLRTEMRSQIIRLYAGVQPQGGEDRRERNAAEQRDPPAECNEPLQPPGIRPSKRHGQHDGDKHRAHKRQPSVAKPEVNHGVTSR